MKLIPFKTQAAELPLRVLLSLDKQIKSVEGYANNPDHPNNKSAKEVLKSIEKYPELRDGIEDWSQLPKYEKELNILLEPLFPETLQDNEIKAVVMPFKYHAFNPTRRFENILNNAGDDYVFDIIGYDDDKLYYYASSFILMAYYKQAFKVSRPIYANIPDQRTGMMRHYRALFNADAMEIIKTDKAPDLTQEDFDELLVAGENLEVWKKKIPPNSYILKGYGMMNLYDATNDMIISKTRSIFLRNDENVFPEFAQNLRHLFGIKDLQVGYSVYNTKTEESVGTYFKRGSKSLFLDDNENIKYQNMFCDGVSGCALKKNKILAIADVDYYGKMTNKNLFYQKLSKKGIKSLILVPMKIKQGFVQMIELASTRKNELNDLNASVLNDLIPFIQTASERYFDESQNILESTIQEHYTSIHPTVKWRFLDAVNVYNQEKAAGKENPVLEDIVFEEVYPLYGQLDIKGSSTARNTAIQTDLALQLSLVIETFKKVMSVQPFPIYKNLVFRVQKYLDRVTSGLNAGDETGILEFLKHEINPVFNHLRTLNPEFEAAVEGYCSMIDPKLQLVYLKRKMYEDSVTMLNERLATYLDGKQEEAQKMFPHYYERYKTDGVEFNMYIGDQLVNDQEFKPLHLHNLRLWQLQMICELEQVAYDLKDEMPYPLKVASLVLIHSNPLAIAFSMEQKQFDVNGAYNARYEIIKKRIDKSHIKGTDERLTQPGKIAIVYSQNRDAKEYLKYIEYLQSENLVGKVEMLDLEDLQGVSGLKAIRVEMIYKEKEKKRKNGVKTRKLKAEAVVG